MSELRADSSLLSPPTRRGFLKGAIAAMLVPATRGVHRPSLSDRNAILRLQNRLPHRLESQISLSQQYRSTAARLPSQSLPKITPVVRCQKCLRLVSLETPEPDATGYQNLMRQNPKLTLKPLPPYSYLGRMLLLANNCQSQMLKGPCGTLTSGAQVFVIEAIESQDGKQHRRTEEKRRIVEETLATEASVAMVVRRHGVNANHAFHWRSLYQAGLLGTSFAEGESSARNGNHRAIIAA